MAALGAAAAAKTVISTVLSNGNNLNTNIVNTGINNNFRKQI